MPTNEKYWKEQLQVLQTEINELTGYISTLEQEHTAMRARNERLEKEVTDLELLLRSK